MVLAHLRYRLDFTRYTYFGIALARSLIGEPNGSTRNKSLEVPVSRTFLPLLGLGVPFVRAPTGETPMRLVIAKRLQRMQIVTVVSTHFSPVK